MGLGETKGCGGGGPGRARPPRTQGGEPCFLGNIVGVGSLGIHCRASRSEWHCKIFMSRDKSLCPGEVIRRGAAKPLHYRDGPSKQDGSLGQSSSGSCRDG